MTMNPFAGVSQAKILDRSDYFDGGFDGDVEIVKTSITTNRKANAPMFIVLCRVVLSNNHPRHPVGWEGARFLTLGGNTRDTSLGESLAIITRALGMDPTTQAAEAEGLLYQCVQPQYETNNPLIGKRLHLKTTDRPKKNSPGTYTHHQWDPPTGAAGPDYNPAAHMPPQAAPAAAPPAWPPAAPPAAPQAAPAAAPPQPATGPAIPPLPWPPQK